MFVPATVGGDMPPSASCYQTFFQPTFYVQTSLVNGLHVKRGVNVDNCWCPLLSKNVQKFLGQLPGTVAHAQNAEQSSGWEE